MTVHRHKQFVQYLHFVSRSPRFDICREDDGAKYSLSCREQITHFLNFYTLTDGAHKILASLSLVERKSPSPDIHTALTGGAHRFRLLSSRGKSRLPLAWHSRMLSASDQSALPPRVLGGVY
ncbi:zinc finger protein [Trichonephila clavipes]|nr:zinc finger protein [Trichonephila clavipes]